MARYKVDVRPHYSLSSTNTDVHSNIESFYLTLFYLFVVLWIVFTGASGAWNPKARRQELPAYEPTGLQHPLGVRSEQAARAP